jgi:hypothetical protein
MAQLIECGCGSRLRASDSGAFAVCPQCGAEHDVPPSGRLLWSEDVTEQPETPPAEAQQYQSTSPRVARTEAPRFAESKANEMYARVAGGTRVRRRTSTKKRAIRMFILGLVMILGAAALTYYDVDRGLLRMPSLGLTIAGFVTLMKAVMGYTK